MRIIQTTLLAGAAAIGCLGVAALAQSPQPQAPRSQLHVLTVRLPDGLVEQIRYRGDVAPQVVLAPGGAPIGAFAPMIGFGPAADPGAAAANSPFAMLERRSAQMDRQMAEMMRNASLAPPPALAAPGGMQQTALGKLPAGSQSYSFVSSFSGGKACSRSVEITSQGAGQAPRVVSHTSGDCGGQNGVAPRPAAAAPAAAVHEPSAGKVIA
jgi:hypothetical protein